MRRLIHFESRHQPVASNTVFISRLTRNAFWSVAVVVASLLVGSWGYMYFENMRAVDAFANAAMILSGMGPLNPLLTDGGKIFASLYAIASGFLLLGLASLLLLPVFHRVLHRFHADEADFSDRPKPSPPPPPRASGPPQPPPLPLPRRWRLGPQPPPLPLGLSLRRPRCPPRPPR